MEQIAIGTGRDGLSDNLDAIMLDRIRYGPLVSKRRISRATSMPEGQASRRCRERACRADDGERCRSPTYRRHTHHLTVQSGEALDKGTDACTDEYLVIGENNSDVSMMGFAIVGIVADQYELGELLSF